MKYESFSESVSVNWHGTLENSNIFCEIRHKERGHLMWLFSFTHYSETSWQNNAFISFHTNLISFPSGGKIKSLVLYWTQKTALSGTLLFYDWKMLFIYQVWDLQGQFWMHLKIHGHRLLKISCCKQRGKTLMLLQRCPSLLKALQSSHQENNYPEPYKFHLLLPSLCLSEKCLRTNLKRPEVFNYCIPF